MSLIMQKARGFIYKNARPLDFARFRFHFEGGLADDVLNCLIAYQNADGGFGHALEPDAWNPNSAPLQTWVATEILREIGHHDVDHPIVQGIIKYLTSGADFNGDFWYNTVVTNNDYPHAPWWHTESDSTSHNDYNPTACLAGFLMRFSEQGSAAHDLSCRIAKAGYAQLMDAGRENDMHTLACYLRMYEYCRDAGGIQGIDMDQFAARLGECVAGTITKDVASWETSYACKPSQFIESKADMLYDENRELVNAECDMIKRTQLDDGSWLIPWGWNGYEEQWAISKNWWKSNGIIINLRYLRAMASP